MSFKTVIVRTGSPTQFDQFEYGTVCKSADHHHDKYELHLQVGKNEASPNWESLGFFHTDSPKEYIDELISLRLKKN